MLSNVPSTPGRVEADALTVSGVVVMLCVEVDVGTVDASFSACALDDVSM